MSLDVDTIAAVATAPGFGAIAVVRISGPDAVRVLVCLAPGLTEDPTPRYATLLELHDPVDGSRLDRAVATFFRAPASYTGEDVVELSVHGGALLPGLVLAACIAAGARAAEPGEFTRRAYLRGKLDLVQAEAVADLVEARNRALHKAALVHLDRGLSARVDALRAGLVSLEALLAHHVDFPEEDDAPTPIAEIAERAEALLHQFDALLGTAPEGELLREGALTVLAGRPNAGKSSLYNALLGQERAIVTDEPGTTRDALEATAQIGGYPFRLVDTAGLRDPQGRVEQLGIEVARRYLRSADMVLLCVPAHAEITDEEAAFADIVGAPVVLVRTMADLGGAGDPTLDSGRFTRVVGASATTGEGLDELRRAMPEIVFTTLMAADEEAPVVTRRRQATALRLAREEVAAFGRALSDGFPPEVAEAHLRTASSALEEMLGVISVDDVLDVVFREFCIGK